MKPSTNSGIGSTGVFTRFCRVSLITTCCMEIQSRTTGVSPLNGFCFLRDPGLWSARSAGYCPFQPSRSSPGYFFIFDLLKHPTRFSKQANEKVSLRTLRFCTKRFRFPSPALNRFNGHLPVPRSRLSYSKRYINSKQRSHLFVVRGLCHLPGYVLVTYLVRGLGVHKLSLLRDFFNHLLSVR